MRSHVHIGILNKRDNIAQIAVSTFDPHIEETMGALVNGSTVILLHPDGNMDLAYLLQTMREKQITYVLAVPSLLNSLYTYIHKNKVSPLTTIRTLCYTGK
jgi:non-ribosomal peptide synthetase component F